MSLVKLNIRQISAWKVLCRFVSLSALIVTASDDAADVLSTVEVSEASLIESAVVSRAVSGSSFLLSLSTPMTRSPYPYPCGSKARTGMFARDFERQQIMFLCFLPPFVPSNADRVM
jgi:hypothetical protein